MLRRLSATSLFSIAAVFCTFFFQVICTHILVPRDNGILSTWLTDISYVSIAFVLGLDSSLLYFAKKGEDISKNIFKNFVIYFSMLVLLLFVTALFPVNKFYYYTLVFTVFFMALINLFRAYFQYQEKFREFNVLILLRPCFIVFSFVGIFLLLGEIKINSAIISFCVATFFAFVISFYMFFKKGNIKITKINLFDKKYYLYGFKSILNKILSLLLYASCIYALKYLDGYESVAYFFVASSISKLTWVIPNSAGDIMYPVFLKIKSHQDNINALELMYKYARVNLLINIIVLVGFILLGKLFLKIFYTDSYMQSYGVVIILLIGNHGMVFYKFISRYLAAKNNWTPLYLALSVGIVVNLSFNYFLIPIWGIYGAALASSISFWSCGLVLSTYIKGSFIGFFDVITFVKSFITHPIR